MRKKKVFALFLSACVFGLALSGCQGGDSGTASTAAGSGAGETTSFVETTAAENGDAAPANTAGETVPVQGTDSVSGSGKTVSQVQAKGNSPVQNSTAPTAKGSASSVNPEKPATPTDPKKPDQPVKPDPNLRIMSFNVAGEQGNILEGTYKTMRVPLFAKVIQSNSPDSIGTQEMTASWISSLKSKLPGYTAVGVGRDDGKNKGEFNSIFYRNDKYTLVSSGTFWLSKTPNKPSIYDSNTGCNRVCTWAVLKNKKTGQTYAHLNTHLDNASGAARDYGAKLVREKADSLNMPVVITGDFNTSYGSVPCQTIVSGEQYASARLSAASTMEGGTYHAWGAYSPWELDYCFARTSAFTVSRYRVLNSKVDNTFVSDHYAVCVDLLWK